MVTEASRPFDPSRPFSRRDALAAGLTPDELGGPRYQRLFHGLYLASSTRADVWQRARAALVICPRGSYISHETAGTLWGGSLDEIGETHVSVPDGAYRPQRRGVVAHRAWPAFNAVRHRGLPMSAPTKVFLELAAAGRTLLELVVLGDSLVKARRTTPRDLVVAAAQHVGAGARLARLAASYVRDGVDSPAETRLRMLIVLARLPEPVVNHVVRDRDGAWMRRFDLSYPGLKLIIEYDGRQHRDVRAQWTGDLRRREELEQDGWRLLVLTADDLYRDPSGTLDRIRQALAERGVRCSQRIPAEWYRAFGPDLAAAS